MTVIDSGTLRVWYALNAADIKKPETYDDLQRLEIGTQLSKYYSFFVFHNDSLIMEWRKKHPKSETVPRWLGTSGKLLRECLWSEYSHTDYFKHYKTNELQAFTNMPMGTPGIQQSVYTEDIPVQKWEIGQELAVIAGCLCRQAVCRFRGRDYVAWFTSEIPVDNGPWKFGGLPGLILKVYDSDKLYVYECVKIERLDQPFPIRKQGLDYKAIDRSEYRKLVTDINTDFTELSGSPRYSDKPIEAVPYHPLELE
jgi:GLPGLI family protein